MTALRGRSRVRSTRRAPGVAALAAVQSRVLLADAREMARVFMLLELLGAVLLLVWLLFPGDVTLGRGWLALLAIVGVAQALGVGMVRRPLGVRVYSLLLGSVVALLGVGVYFSGAALSPLLLFYVWIVAYAGWYLPARHVSIQVLWIVFSYGLALVIHQDPGQAHWWSMSNADASRWMLLSGTVVSTALMVKMFRGRFLDNEQRFVLAFERSATPMTLTGLDGRVIQANDAFCSLLGRSASEVIGMSDSSFSHPCDRDAASGFFERALDPGWSARSERCLLRADGTAVWVDLVSSLVSDQRGRPLYYFEQALDVTARRAAEVRVARSAAQHAAIASIGRAAVQGAELNALCAEVASAAAGLLELELAVVLERLPESPCGRVRAAHGIAAERWGNAPVERLPVVEFTLACGEPVIVEDWAEETRFRISDPERELSAASAVAVLIRGHREPFGVLLCESEQSGKFTDDDVNFLRGLANMLAATIEQRHAQEEALHASLHDSLTGLPNRVLLADLLRRSLQQPHRPRTSVAVAFIDLDQFKLVNDSLGHEVGDQLLRDVVTRLSSGLRVSDTLARFTSDEFVVLCEELPNERAAMRVAQRLLDTLATPFQIAGEEITINATVGIAVAGDNDSAHILLRDAEAAMHRAKERSRGGYELFDPEIHARNIGRLRSENALRRAIGTDQLSLVYQPVINMRTGAIDSVEALLRWQHPERGAVSPLEFIPIAEESGMIIPIGRQVLRDSTRQLATWRSEGHQISVSVNISARQLYDDALIELLAATLQSSGVPPESLTLELTETALVADGDVALRVLRAAKNLGVLLALDDYGTGYASLSYLSRYPFDIVKLDQTLIQMIEKSRKDEIIVASTIDMGHALGLTLVAEGVETHGQDAKLHELGCDLVQGYHHAKPMHPSELEALPTWTKPQGTASEPSVIA